MNRLLLILAITATVGSLLSFQPGRRAVTSSCQESRARRDHQRAEIELATDHLTIIRWTTNNPGGSDVHYGIVHYGTDPKDLSQTAKSPIRLNQAIPPRFSACAWRASSQGRPTTTGLPRRRAMARAMG